LLFSSSLACAQDVASVGHPDAGAIVFKKCMACHQIGEGARNGIGPVLNGIANRPAGSYPGYNYSQATKNAGLVWDDRTLARYLRAPREVIPGTRMAFAGLSKDREILDVISYLKQFNAAGVKATP
jgi:cytochrome c